ncbi:hypothetical protein BN132_3630 [Cronobacter turicensis 564]|nr:hypothetical protein BN132_3630 [Cronobacter turicensis 564]
MAIREFIVQRFKQGGGSYGNPGLFLKLSAKRRFRRFARFNFTARELSVNNRLA